jgi:hypothetical protein
MPPPLAFVVVLFSNVQPTIRGAAPTSLRMAPPPNEVFPLKKQSVMVGLLASTLTTAPPPLSSRCWSGSRISATARLSVKVHWEIEGELPKPFAIAPPACSAELA